MLQMQMTDNMARTYKWLYEAGEPPLTLAPLAEALDVTVMSVTRYVRELQEVGALSINETATGRIRAPGIRLLMTPEEILEQMEIPPGLTIIQDLADAPSNEH